MKTYSHSVSLVKLLYHVIFNNDAVIYAYPIPRAWLQPYHRTIVMTCLKCQEIVKHIPPYSRFKSCYVLVASLMSPVASLVTTDQQCSNVSMWRISKKCFLFPGIVLSLYLLEKILLLLQYYYYNYYYCLLLLLLLTIITTTRVDSVNKSIISWKTTLTCSLYSLTDQDGICELIYTILEMMIIEKFEKP